jgi:glyoxylase-like metal-dependent hydrolase (beta-lactamase superfamily II)
MLLRSSAPVYPSIYLLTLGATCRYAIVASDGSIALTDPGASVHVQSLTDRLASVGLNIENITRVLLTHLDADRIGGLPLLRRLVPNITVYGTAAMHAQLQDEQFVRALWEQDQQISRWFPSHHELPQLSFEEFKSALKIDAFLVESDTIALDEELLVRVVATPGHRKHSVSFLVVPYQFLIGDETFGYNQGRQLCAPGADFDLHAARQSIKRFADLEISGIGLPYVGALTGDLAKKHLTMVEVNSNDLVNEVKQALESGVTEDEIRRQVREAFYTSSLGDPCLRSSLKGSFEALWKQMGRG